MIPETWSLTIWEAVKIDFIKPLFLWFKPVSIKVLDGWIGPDYYWKRKWTAHATIVLPTTKDSKSELDTPLMALEPWATLKLVIFLLIQFLEWLYWHRGLYYVTEVNGKRVWCLLEPEGEHCFYDGNYKAHWYLLHWKHASHYNIWNGWD